MERILHVLYMLVRVRFGRSPQHHYTISWVCATLCMHVFDAFRWISFLCAWMRMRCVCARVCVRTKFLSTEENQKNVWKEKKVRISGEQVRTSRRYLLLAVATAAAAVATSIQHTIFYIAKNEYMLCTYKIFNPLVCWDAMMMRDTDTERCKNAPKTEQTIFCRFGNPLFFFFFFVYYLFYILDAKHNVAVTSLDIYELTGNVKWKIEFCFHSHFAQDLHTNWMFHTEMPICSLHSHGIHSNRSGICRIGQRIYFDVIFFTNL